MIKENFSFLGLQTTISDFHSEMNTSRHHFVDKNDKFGGTDMTSQSTKMTSRSLNPELLMREFMHDDVEDDEVKTTTFKDDFSKKLDRFTIKYLFFPHGSFIKDGTQYVPLSGLQVLRLVYCRHNILDHLPLSRDFMI